MPPRPPDSYPPPEKGYPDFPGPHVDTRIRRKNGTLIVLLLLLLLGVFWSVGKWGTKALVSLLDYSVDQRLGELASSEMFSASELCTNPALLDAVQEIVDRLSKEVEEQYLPLTVHVLDNPEVNAFALPGGQMFVFTGLLKQLNSPEELAGILGHEIGHVVHRHGLIGLARTMWFQLTFSLVLGDIAGPGGGLSALAGNLALLKFSRDQEAESDLYGINLMLAADIPPLGFPDFLQKRDEFELISWFSTHPNPVERAESLRTMIESLEGERSDNWFPPSLEALKAPCSN